MADMVEMKKRGNFMRYPEMEGVEQKITSDEVSALEGRLGITLPVEYRDWLIRYNGGRPIPGFFRFRRPISNETIPWIEERDRLGSFLAIYDAKIANLELSYRWWKQTTRRLPKELVPVAYVSGSSDRVCLSISGPDYGKVFFWDFNNEPAPGEPVTYANCYPIAETFNEFLEMLAKKDAEPHAELEKAKASFRNRILNAHFPPKLEAQCAAVEAKHPRIREWIRTVSLELFDAKDYQVLYFYNDPASFRFLDMLFYLKEIAAGPGSMRTLTDAGHVVDEWYYSDAESFGLSGNAPGFVEEWIKDRLSKGNLVQSDKGPVFSTKASAIMISAMDNAKRSRVESL